ncbi:MAG: relaxase domain-containing protein, partial [Acidimicrobiales bacterium]
MRPPKSVSILHALGSLVPPPPWRRGDCPPTCRPRCWPPTTRAVADAVAVLERHAAFIRGPGGRVPALGLVIASFDHRSSRMGNPLLHTHLVVANVARGVDGRMAAVDGTVLYPWARAAGFVYQARLRAELIRRPGVEFAPPHNGVADLVGTPGPSSSTASPSAPPGATPSWPPWGAAVPAPPRGRCWPPGRPRAPTPTRA